MTGAINTVTSLACFSREHRIWNYERDCFDFHRKILFPFQRKWMNALGLDDVTGHQLFFLSNAFGDLLQRYEHVAKTMFRSLVMIKYCVESTTVENRKTNQKRGIQ